MEINAPDVVGLFVQQSGLARILERRFEPEPAFRREIGSHFDVSDQEVVLEHPPIKAEAHHIPNGRPCTVTGDQPIRFDLIGPIRCIDIQNDMIVHSGHPRHSVAPPNFDRCPISLGRANFFNEELFEIGLLQVDKGRVLMPVLGLEIEFENPVLSVKHLADIPHHALVAHPLACTQTVRDFQRAFGEADRTATLPDPFVIVQHQHRCALAPQIKGSGHSDWTTANDYHGVALRRLRLRRNGCIRVQLERKIVADVDHSVTPATVPTSRCPACLSRCADGRCRVPRHRRGPR